MADVDVEAMLDAGGEKKAPADEEQRTEPARTERLQRQQLWLFKSFASDALDAMRLTWFPRANGRSFVGVSYDLLAIFVNQLIASINAVGANTEPGTDKATYIIVFVIVIIIGYCCCVKTSPPRPPRLPRTPQSSQYCRISVS